MLERNRPVGCDDGSDLSPSHPILLKVLSRGGVVICICSRVKSSRAFGESSRNVNWEEPIQKEKAPLGAPGFRCRIPLLCRDSVEQHSSCSQWAASFHGSNVDAVIQVAMVQSSAETIFDGM